jgi:subtilase family serine protease
MQRMLLVLQRGADQEASLRQLLDQQQVVSSSQFHQWLTPEQFGQQFGPADSDLQAVTGWLAAQGFEVTKVAAGRTVIEFSGTAGLVRKVLGTEIHKFRVNGEDYWANASDPQIPAALAAVVAGIDSFNNFPRKPLHESVGTFRRDKATGMVEPLFSNPTTCSGGGSGCYNLTVGPGDFATIYNILPLWNALTPIDGTGQAIAVVGETNINIQDVRDFRAMFGLSANDPNIILNGPDPGILTDGEETEADLDVEWSGGVAKGATVDFVVSESTETTAGIDLSALYIVDNNLAPILSESYGGCEQSLGAAGNAFYNTLWEQAAAQGITVLLGSGDSGSAGCDSANPIIGEIAAQHGLAVSGFASTPFNVAVGGTDFALTQSNYSTYWSTANTPPYQSSAKSYIPETTWSYSCADSGGLSGCTPPPDSSYLDAGYYLVAGGGGSSQVYPKPTWQIGTPQDGVRDIPDVSLLAGSWYVICEMDANASGGGSSTSCDLNSPYLDFQLEAGTSAAVQAFAGVMALVNQAHGRQGNANYVLYPLATAANTCASTAAAVSKTSCIFYDTQTGNNSVICAGGSPNCSVATSGQYGIIVSGNAAAYPTTAGYDLATGLGTVNVANLVQNWKSNFTTAATTLTLTPTPPATLTTLVHGQAVGFNISVTSGSGTPSGDVSLIAQTGAGSNNATAIGPFTLSGGSAAGSTVMLPGGSYNVTAHYAGNGTYGAGDSNPGIPVTVSKEDSLTEIHLVTFDSSGNIISNNGTVGYGSPYVLRMDVTNSSGNLCANQVTQVISYPCPTNGSNAFGLTVSPAPTDVNAPTGTTPGQYRLNSQGYAEDQPIQLSVGQYPFVASYAGDSSYNPSSSSTPLTVTVTQAPTTTSISGVPSSGAAGTQMSVTATLTTASNGVAPTGTMQLLNNGSPLGNSVLVSGSAATSSAYATAQATLPLTLQAGSLSITARYSGDVNYAASTSAATSITVGDFGLSANPSAVAISAPGQQGSSIISVTPQNGFTGSINLSVASGCPTGATCTFASPSINVSSASAATDALTITTTGTGSTLPTLQRRIPPSFRLPVGLLWFLAGSLALGMLLRSSAMRRRPAALMFATTLLAVGVWAACGGGGGGGTPAPTPVPAVGLSATTLNFSSVNTGSTSAAQTVTLTNTGTGSLSITSIGLTGTNPGDYSDTYTCGSSLAAGANCSISVKFAPTATGTRSATVSIVDNASGSPHSISLIGTGTQPAPPTPAGTYPIVVNAVSGGDTHTLTVNVTVQ